MAEDSSFCIPLRLHFVCVRSSFIVEDRSYSGSLLQIALEPTPFPIMKASHLARGCRANISRLRADGGSLAPHVHLSPSSRLLRVNAFSVISILSLPSQFSFLRSRTISIPLPQQLFTPCSPYTKPHLYLLQPSPFYTFETWQKSLISGQPSIIGDELMEKAI